VSGLNPSTTVSSLSSGSSALDTLHVVDSRYTHFHKNVAWITAGNASPLTDGAAAVVLRAGDGGATRVESTGEKLWPDTLDIMGWSVDPEGFGVIFQRTIPDFVKENMGPAVTEILSRMELSLGDIDRFICHPGGAKVIAALERAFALHQGTLDHERGVIADYGNMSAPTVLFVLERALAQGLPPQSLLTALGPGFTASCVALRHAK